MCVSPVSAGLYTTSTDSGLDLRFRQARLAKKDVLTSIKDIGQNHII